jgi:hypothetical protein
MNRRYTMRESYVGGGAFQNNSGCGGISAWSKAVSANPAPIGGSSFLLTSIGDLFTPSYFLHDPKIATKRESLELALSKYCSVMPHCVDTPVDPGAELPMSVQSGFRASATSILGGAILLPNLSSRVGSSGWIWNLTALQQWKEVELYSAQMYAPAVTALKNQVFVFGTNKTGSLCPIFDVVERVWTSAKSTLCSIGTGPGAGTSDGAVPIVAFPSHDNFAVSVVSVKSGSPVLVEKIQLTKMTKVVQSVLMIDENHTCIFLADDTGAWSAEVATVGSKHTTSLPLPPSGTFRSAGIAGFNARPHRTPGTASCLHSAERAHKVIQRMPIMKRYEMVRIHR